MRYRFLLAGVVACAILGGQNAPNLDTEAAERARRSAVVWATGVAGKFATISNTVVSAYSLGQLATFTCEYDQTAASGMFRQAISRLNSVPAEIFFDEKAPRLPVGSFTRLWRTISADVKKCDASLSGSIDTQAFELRRADERRNANNSVIDRIMVQKRYEQDPDRTAQLADLVLDAGDPAALDFNGFGLFLAKLRERSPELADDIFKHALETVAGAPLPEMLDLDTLGKYLFVDPFPDHRFQPDDKNLYRSYTVGGTSIYDLRAPRLSANPDLVGVYIDTLRQMVEQALSPQGNPVANSRYDPIAAYSIALQMLAHARDLDLASADTLTQLLPKIYTSAAAQVEAQLRTPQSDTGVLADRNRRVREIISAVRRKKFDDARRATSGIADAQTTRQLGPLIDFAEASAALASGDIEAAIRLTNRVQPGGVKRAMLYAGIVSRTPNPQHEGYVALGTRDVQSLSPEFRAAMFSVMAVALLEQKNPERAYTILREIVVALNDARVNPRQARFDPARIRGLTTESSQGLASTTDIPSIPLATNRFYVVIDTGEGRLNYELSVPGIFVFTLPGVVRQAQALDPQQLESLITGVRDETKQAEAYLAVAELRFKKSAVAP